MQLKKFLSKERLNITLQLRFEAKVSWTLQFVFMDMLASATSWISLTHFSSDSPPKFFSPLWRRDTCLSKLLHFRPSKSLTPDLLCNFSSFSTNSWISSSNTMLASLPSQIPFLPCKQITKLNSKERIKRYGKFKIRIKIISFRKLCLIAERLSQNYTN